MMNQDNRLYELHHKAIEELTTGPQFNWTLEFECIARDLQNLAMTDVTSEAQGWRSRERPPDYYFTHAEYYKDGINHIIRELTEKPTSNRALYSLINQDQISSSGDKPIPSFMSLQCQLDGDVLYCTCYFRALEVSKFLKINLEEIRLTLIEICTSLPTISTIHLTIFAFRAYIDQDRSPLKRPKIEAMHDDEIAMILTGVTGTESATRVLDSMLRELRGAVTVVSTKKLETLKRIVSKYGQAIPNTLRTPLFKQHITACIGAATNLSKLRERGSHGNRIDEAIKDYQAAIDNLIKDLDE